MKKLLLLLGVIGLLGTVSYGQQIPFTEVPDTVFKTFHTQFGAVQKSEWAREEGNIYRVLFYISKNKHPHIATFDSKGNWLEKTIEIEFSQLPMTVIETIVEQFQIFKPLSTVRVETNGNQTVYRINLSKTQSNTTLNEAYALEFSPQGQMLKNTQQSLAKSDEKE
jgi:hypothetical protein